MQVLDPHAGINYPTDQPVSMDEHFYKTVIQNITECLRGIELDEKYLNSLLSVLEANLSYIPSSTSKKELTDISLYDHIKNDSSDRSVYRTVSGRKTGKKL